MIPRNNNYFSPELIEGGHYIITGLLDDNFIDDLYQPLNVTELLHSELKKNDFDVILFFDYNRRLYCYDRESGYIFLHANDDSEEETKSRRKPPSGPLGPPRSRRATVRSDTNGNPYSRTRMELSLAWQHVIALLRQTRYRCAMVFSDIVSLSFSMPVGVLQALAELNSAVTDRPHAAFYMFHAVNGTKFEQFETNNNPVWIAFFRQILRPLFETNDPEKNRVINLSTPNAKEISNLLNMLRLKRRGGLPVNMMEFKALSEALAYICATHNKSLRSLKVALGEFIRKHPGKALTLENYHEVLAVKKEKTALEEIHSLIGLDDVKKWIDEWTFSRKKDNKGRTFPVSSSRFFPNEKTSVKNGLILNVIFTGKPGTGKSTLAAQLGRLYYELELLPKGHLVQCSASNIVSPHIGGTAPLVRERVMEAMGGVLMIDEAYALSKNAHGKEAIDQLVNEMTQYAGQFAVVICGYEAPMRKFLAANQGLASRFATTLHLEDYTHQQMEKIFRKFMATKDENGYIAKMDDELERIFPDFCDNWANDHDNNWGNAREASTLLENMRRKALARLRANGEDVTDSQLILTKEDVPDAQKKHLKLKPKKVEDIIKMLTASDDELVSESAKAAGIEPIIGLYNVKKRLHSLAQTLSWKKDAESEPDNAKMEPGRYIFHGPPGTGKTHMARLFCNLLFRLGILKRNYVYEVSAKQLCHPDPEFDYGLDNGRQPTIMEILEAAFENAKGGIIFIDEAPQFLDDELGKNVLRALVPIIERPDVKKNTCVILAGYTDKISCLLREDAGLSSRFPEGNRIRFDNYSATDLAKLCDHFAKSQGHTATEEFKERSRAAFSRYLENPDREFGNARFIRDTYIPGAIEAKSARLSKTFKEDESGIANENDVYNVEKPTRTKLTEEDIPSVRFKKMAGPLGIPVMPEQTVAQKIDSLVGKQEIKEYLNSLSEKDDSLQFYDEVNAVESHFAIIGPTGSGRHTAARVIASALAYAGIIDRDEVLVTSKGSFESDHVGGTIPKTMAEIEKAKGGCMLVEYPSTMLAKNARDNTYGLEALSAIGGAMGGGTDKLSVIFIDDENGFEALTKQMPSIVGKFSRVFRLEDLTPLEMYELFKKKTEHSFYFHKNDPLKDIMPDFFINWVSRRGELKENASIWSGGNEVDHLVTDLKNNWKKFSNIADTTKTPKRRITKNLFPKNLQKFLLSASEDKNEALGKLDNLIGLESVKKAIKAIEREKRIFKNKALPGFYAFVGDPGSGKTMVAKLFGGILRGAEALSQGHVIVRTAKDLAQGEADSNLEGFAKKTNGFEDCLKLAKNGVLFIDEAPSLRKTGAGQAVLDKLLTTIEDTEVMKDVCIILAGYETEMYELFELDRGFASRFQAPNSILRFENYDEKQLLSIMDAFAQKADSDEYINAPFKLDVSDPDFRSTSEQIFKIIKNKENFGNGRFVRNYLRECIAKLLERVDNMPPETDKTDKVLLSTFTEADIPNQYRELLSKSEKPAIIEFSKLKTEEIQPITEDNYSEMLEKIKRSTVLIMATDDKGNESTGTGFIISKEGHVLTCNHVLRGAKTLQAKVYTPGAVGGDYHTYDMEALVPGYGLFDMAMGKLVGTNFKALSLRPGTEPINLAENVVTVCYPLGGNLNGGNLKTLNPNPYTGSVGAWQIHTPSNLETFDLDIIAMPGCSGCPIVSKTDGRVIGILPGAHNDHPDPEKAKHHLPYFYPIKYFWSSFVDFESEDNHE